MYLVDTGHFYTNHERYLHNQNHKYRAERKYLLNQNKSLDKDSELYQRNEKLIAHKRLKAKASKEALLSTLQNKIKHKNKKPRVLKGSLLHDNDVVSVFESSLTRAANIDPDTLTDELIIVQIYYFDIFKDILFNGFTFKGERYIYYTSSAGQIRKKKAVFIKERTWQRIQKTIMCGLTVEKINEHGGNNINKHLAYLALQNSATDKWESFDIDRCIVVDDFETDVFGTFDFIDESDYSVTRKQGYIPVPHTDGAGMILPSVSKKNMMVRLPWIKGLLGSFNFRKFIVEYDCSPIVKDIYGKEHDVLKEDIRIIFTKSQFKLWKHYSSWDDYKENFKQYHCQAGVCNIEEDRIQNARINYQMLQTLTDFTDDDLNYLTSKSTDNLVSLCTSVETMKNVLGVSPTNTSPTAYQKAVRLYPPLLRDTYSLDVLKELKESLLRKYWSGKLEVAGKYTFILPDLYAFCEYLFKGEHNPQGLLDNDEVYCRLFEKKKELDCLRSPHLYKEHAIRTNVCAIKGDKKKAVERWFLTDGLYTSTHDLISKILMFDVDGDKSLVIGDERFVQIAKKNMCDIVPLYYNMRKAQPVQINNESIYEGLHAAFVGGNIGVYSNNISKIWNDPIFSTGTKEEKEQAIQCVKQLCCQNNFVIDSI